MVWQVLYLFVIFTAVLISCWIAVHAWRQRAKPGALYFMGMMLAVAEWLFTSGMVSMSQTSAQARWWVDPRYFGLTAMLAFFIAYVIQYSGHAKWLSRPVRVFVFSVPILTQLIIATNAWHHWFLVEVDFSRDGILMGLDAVRYGPLFWLHTVYCYLLVLVGIVLIVRMSIRRYHLYRLQAVVMVLGVLPPLLSSVIDAFLLIPGLKHPLAPLGFALMGMAFAYAMFRHRMLDIVPVARDRVIESMSDAMLVLDERGNVVDVNPAACRLLEVAPAWVIGRPVTTILQPWIELAQRYEGQLFAESEIALTIAGKDRCFDLRISPLSGVRTNGGRVIVLRDITARKQAETRLQTSLDTVRALQTELYEQTIRDPLTGLYNRRFLAEILPRELARVARDDCPLSVVMMDIDDFKLVNDTFGHEAGDRALQCLAGVLNANIRASDYVFRYGGEEFLALLPATQPGSAYQIAERWRECLQSARLTYNGCPIQVTMSLGISTFVTGVEEIDDIFAAADQAMYRAKAEGRNRVLLADLREFELKRGQFGYLS